MVLRHIPLRGVSSLNLLCSCQCEDWNHPPLTLHVICPKTFRFDQFFQLCAPSRRLGIYSGGEITIFISIAVGVAFTYPSENNSGWPSNYQFSGNFHFSRFLSLKLHNCSENKKYTKIAQFVSLLSPQSKVWFRKKRRNLAARKNSQFGWFTYFWIFS